MVSKKKCVGRVVEMRGFLMIKRKDGNGALKKHFLYQIKVLFSRHKAMFCFLFFLFIYEIFIVWQFRDWEIGNYNYAYHALDYSVGFCSRLLVGAVSNFLLGGVTVFKVTVLETVLLIFIFVCLSFFLEKLYLRFDTADRPFVLLLIFLFVTGPCTFGIYVKELGMLDVWWLLCTLIIFFLLSKKKLRPLIVIFAFILTLIYFSSILCFAPFVVIILLYKATVETDLKSRRQLYIIAGLFVVFSIGSAVYFINFGHINIQLSPDAFISLLEARGCGEDNEEVYHVMYSIPPEEYAVPFETKSEILNQILVRVQFHLSIYNENEKGRLFLLLNAFLLVLPVLILIFYIFHYKQKNSKPISHKLLFFCMLMLFFFVNITCAFVTTDNIKWLAHGFTLTFACFLVVLYHEPRLFREKVKPRLRAVPIPVWVCYCVIYALTVYHPYS
ncbi:MAG: hypothetical protein IJK02_01575 [Clostridia bacterium]|nr:hypothetical protein [Clostridia bacterium]